jgi:hypothetical protein
MIKINNYLVKKPLIVQICSFSCMHNDFLHLTRCISDNVTLITKNICLNYNLNGDEDLCWGLSSRGTDIEKKYSPQAFVGMNN